ncbi:hypothetical protein KZZ52_24865 [Dactylosporangium sp. AC04546]|uniref:hypothetical protein n=1 Tax=Dactylosporangium sp. AC04546 TaxID=2862460 RepID=UPI001EE07BBA|nr:hypothetical protein [Dactylosporangium sp. AC04546]WVK88504.1 hypothetical protein KZZ52_24865 [Dactylosporangium sp. AC04546]
MTDFQSLLDAAAADPRSRAWDEIWQRSNDQGEYHAASAELLPWLATTCAAFRPEDREKALILAGFVAVDAPETRREHYAADIAALRTMALDRLPVTPSPDGDFVYLLQAVLGFEGDERWGKELDRINDGEADVTCPSCENDMYMDLAETEPGLPGPLAIRLHGLALAAGREAVATAITHLFGRTTCSACGEAFRAL